MFNDNPNIERKYERERNLRKKLERILIEKGTELRNTNDQLVALNAELEKEVDKRTEVIRKREKELRDMFESHPLPVIVYDKKSLQILAFNTVGIKYYGYKQTELSTLRYSDLFDEYDEKIHKPTGYDPDLHIEAKHLKKDGSIQDVEISSTEISYNNEEAVLALIIDVTDRNRVNNMLAQSERKYREVVESASDIIYRSDIKGFFTYVNPTAEKLTGFSEKELIGAHYTSLIYNEDRELVNAFYKKQAYSPEKTSYLEFRIVTKSRRIIWIGQTVDRQQLEDGSIEFISLARDITQRKQAQIALMRSEEKYRSIIENLELGLLEVDVDDRIMKVYPQFCELTGYQVEELIGQKAGEVLLTEEYRRQMKKRRANRAKGISEVYEMQIVKKNGDLLWVIVSAAPFYDEANNLRGSIGIHLDITPRKQMEQDLRKAKEIAEQSVASRELFMANMSHEIRTPMNAIIGMGELLSQSELDENQSEYLSAIQTSAGNLLVIINDILDFSKIESGKMEFETIDCHVQDLCKEAFNALKVKASSRNIRYQLNIDNINHPFIKTDPTRLNQVFLNLLSNAIKFTENGEVTLSAEEKEFKDDTVRIEFKVIDTGIGIPEDKLDMIFESFIQESESTSRKFGGTGLGLAISKQLVEIMGGDIKVTSKPGKGSVFSFELTFNLGTEKVKQKTGGKNGAETNLDGLRILLAEDNEINRFLAQTVLEQWNCEVDHAVTGKEAYEKAKAKNYDLILMDMRMPEMDGLTATKLIRKELDSTVPIVALTANAIKGELRKCLDVGMNDYVSKPFKQEELLNKIIQWTKDPIKQNV